jgi:hypothetical protein
MSNFPWRASGNVPPVGDGELDALLTAGQPAQHAAPALQPVAELLAALQAAPADSELAGKATALAAFRGAAGQQQREHHLPARRQALLSALLRARLAAVAAGAAVVAVGGTAAAAYAGALPVSLQRVAHVVIAAPAVIARPDPARHAAPGVWHALSGHSAFGLCNAYENGSAAEKAVASGKLVTAADGRGEVKSFCARILHPGAAHARAAGHPASGPARRPGQPARRPGRHDARPGRHERWPGGHVPWPAGHHGWPGLPGIGAALPHGGSAGLQAGEAVPPAAKRVTGHGGKAAHHAGDAVRRAGKPAGPAVQLTYSHGKPTRVPAPGTSRHPQFRPRL